MKLSFEQIKLNNFLSFGEATIPLNQGGYTLVSGVNNNPVDKADSNGSGKSSIWEAISWVLTGETIRGSKDVVNLYGDDGALVELSLKVDDVPYTIIRSKEHSKYKTNLKVIINGEDKSGKGIRDTEKLLKEYIPDLTSELVGSVILLGQGLPQRFSNNSPSGRKEILEKLSKSDFMIEDLKDRISKRKTYLSTKLRESEDSCLRATTLLGVYDTSIQELESKLENLPTSNELRIRYDALKEALSIKEREIKAFEEELTQVRTSHSTAQESYNNLLVEFEKAKGESIKTFNETQLTLQTERVTHRERINSLKAEISKLESITTVCPTCGQPLPNVIKPSTDKQKQELDSEISLLEELNTKYSGLEDEKNKVLENLKTSFQKKLLDAKNMTSQYGNKLDEMSSTSRELRDAFSEIQFNYSKAEVAYTSLEKDKESLLKELEDTKELKQSLQDKLDLLKTEKTTLIQHSDVVNSLNSLVTRDFRGALLQNIIEFIDKKAKEYALDVFETDKMGFTLSGNKISIFYDNKEYENLSGGEKQKVDLIVQFAIRDMLCKFLNFSSNIIVLDELFDNLDGIGCQKVLNLISTKLNDVNSIFIVTHHADIPLPIDNEIIVIKNEKKISYIK